MPDTVDWSGEVAFVTGALGSIGGAIAADLAARGAAVATCDMPDKTAPPSARCYHRVDVAQSAEVDAWVQAAADICGAPTIGIICAGLSIPGRLTEASDADWSRVIDVNLTGAYYTARAIVRQMLIAKVPGRLVFIGSWAAHAPHPHIGAYSASKAGLRALVQTFALELAEKGILVNEVAPGIVDGGLSRELFRRNPALEARTRGAIPADRIIAPEDVARDVAFLASPANRHTTGSVLVSDGGLSLASVMNPGRHP